MKEYKIHGVVSVSCWTTVKAKSGKEALKIAKERELVSHHISNMYGVDEFFHFSNDGMPQELEIDE